jgi:hypothetical protein
MNKKIEKPLISNNQNTVLSKILDEWFFRKVYKLCL